MARFRKIDPRIWNDEKFCKLSDRAQLVFLFILTHPHMTSLGAMRATIAGLASERKWTEKAFREAFQEALREGLIEADETACYVGAPNFLRYNGPESPNVIRAWDKQLDLIPECKLKAVLLQRVKGFTEALSKAFGEALPEAFRKGPCARACDEPEPEPEPEQKQEQEQESNTSVIVADDGRPDPDSKKPTPQQFIDRWNAFVKGKPKLAPVRKLTAERRKKITARLSEADWFDTFRLAIKMLPLGVSEGHTWQPTLDWLIRNESNAFRLAEGEFSWRNADDPAKQKRQANLRKLEAESREERLAEEKKHNRSQSKVTREAIANTLRPRDGNGIAPHGSSLLAGLDREDSSANGADKQKTTFAEVSDALT